MVKVLAETTGDFMITNHPEAIEAHRPSVVTRDGFIDARIGLGQVKVLRELPDHCTDEGWVAKLAEMKVDLNDAKKVEAAADAYAREPAPKADEPAAPPKQLTEAEQKAAEDKAAEIALLEEAVEKKTATDAQKKRLAELKKNG